MVETYPEPAGQIPCRPLKGKCRADHPDQITPVHRIHILRENTNLKC